MKFHLWVPLTLIISRSLVVSCLECRALEVTLRTHNRKVFSYNICDMRARIVIEIEWPSHEHLRSVFVHFPATFLLPSLQNVLHMLRDDLPQTHLPQASHVFHLFMFSAFLVWVIVYAHTSSTKKISPTRKQVKQGCILSPIIFLIVMDEIMRKSVNEARRGITWGLNGVLEDLDFADDVCLLSHRYEDMQNQINDLEKEIKRAHLKINVDKTKK